MFCKQGPVDLLLHGSDLLAYGWVSGDQWVVWDQIQVEQVLWFDRAIRFLRVLELCILLGDGRWIPMGVGVVHWRLVWFNLSCADVAGAVDQSSF